MRDCYSLLFCSLGRTVAKAKAQPARATAVALANRIVCRRVGVVLRLLCPFRKSGRHRDVGSGSGVIGASCLCEPMVQAWPTLPPKVLNGQAGETALVKTAPSRSPPDLPADLPPRSPSQFSPHLCPLSVKTFGQSVSVKTLSMVLSILQKDQEETPGKSQNSPPPPPFPPPLPP